MTARMRADQLLVSRGLFESRARAQEAIEAGLVTADGVTVRKSAQTLPANAELTAEPAHPYVSRGGVKLKAALAHFRFDPGGKICIDLGASTGGFTDVLLRGGARRIYRSMSAPASFIFRCAAAVRLFGWKISTPARSTARLFPSRSNSSRST